MKILEDKKIDHLIVGINYLSLMLSFDLLEKENKVLILDDERVKYGHFFLDHITNIELAYLHEWGKNLNLKCFSNLKSFCKVQKISFFIGNRYIVLGDKPSQNLNELLRKFPLIFRNQKLSNVFENLSLNKNEFDQMMMRVLIQMGIDLYRFQSLERIDYSKLTSFLPPKVVEFFDFFYKYLIEIKDNPDEMIVSFFYFFI